MTEIHFRSEWADRFVRMTLTGDGDEQEERALNSPQRLGLRKMEEMEKSAVFHEREERGCKRLWNVTLIPDDLTFLNIQAIKTLTQGNIK